MKEFARFFSHTFTVLGTSHAAEPNALHPGPAWQPAIDIYECSGRICIYVELPGVQRDQLDVSVEGSILRIVGYRHKNLPDSVEHVHQMEIPYGQFARFVRLPETADVAQINANYENGFLLIEIPRKASK